MKNLFSRFLKDKSGATAIEYGLIAAIVGVGIIVGSQARSGTPSSPPSADVETGLAQAQLIRRADPQSSASWSHPGHLDGFFFFAVLTQGINRLTQPVLNHVAKNAGTM